MLNCLAQKKPPPLVGGGSLLFMRLLAPEQWLGYQEPLLSSVLSKPPPPVSLDEVSSYDELSDEK